MEKQNVTCVEIAQTFGVSNKTVQSWIREFEIPYFKDGDLYLLPPNGFELLEPHIFLTSQQRKDLAMRRKMHRATVRTMKQRSKSAKQAWETRRARATQQEKKLAWDTYGYELFRVGI